jgi:hypothetical protein
VRQLRRLVTREEKISSAGAKKILEGVDQPSKYE